VENLNIRTLDQWGEGCGTQEWAILVECCGWVVWGLDPA